MNYTDREKESSSTFNMSLATLERIDNHIRELSTHLIMGNILHAQRTIMMLYKELYPFLKEKEKKLSMKMFNNIKTSANVTDGKRYFFKNGITDDIMDFDFWIREKLLEKGLLMAQSDDPSRAIEQM